MRGQARRAAGAEICTQKLRVPAEVFLLLVGVGVGGGVYRGGKK